MRPEAEIPGGRGGKERVSLHELDKYLQGELPAEQARAIEALERSDARVREYLEGMRRLDPPLAWNSLRDRAEAEALRRQPGALDRIKGWLAPNPRLGLALLMVLAVSIVPFLYGPGTEGNGLRAKGGKGAEIVLTVDGEEIASGKSATAASGSLIGFSYRSITPLHVQGWFIEDEGAPEPFSGPDGRSLVWPAVSAWTPAPQRIRLEGQWKRQRILVLASGAPIDSAKARAAAADPGAGPAGIRTFVFDLIHP